MPIIRPSLAVDFFNSAPFWEPALGTFSRSGTTGSFVNAIGVQKMAPADAPRVTYDPETGVGAGLLVEPQRINLLLQSEDLTDAAWTKTGSSITGNAAVAPDGNTTADRIVVSAASGNASQAVTISAGQQIGLSIHAKRSASPFLFLEIGDGTNAVQAWFNLDAGTVAATTAGGATCGYVNAGIKARQGGWFRCMLLVNTTTSTAFTAKASAAAKVSQAPSSGDSIYAWGAQLEGNAIGTPTSYIPTTSVAATRSGDLVNATLGSWFNPTEGAFIVEATITGMPQASGNAMAVHIDDGTSNNRMGLYRNSNGGMTCSVQVGAAVQAQIATANNLWTTAWAPHRMGLSYRQDAFSFAADGSLVGTDSSGSVPTVTTLRFGTAGTGTVPLIGGIGRFIYFPRKIADADLAALTK